MEPVSVRVRDCACPGTPHREEGDCVFLAPTLGLEGGLAAQGDIMAAAGNGTALAQRWRVTFVRYGAVGWNLIADDGPLPFDVEALLGDFELGYPVSERADELYGDSVVRPLLRRPSGPSRNGSMGSSISPNVRSTSKRRGSSSLVTSAATEPLTG